MQKWTRYDRCPVNIASCTASGVLYDKACKEVGEANAAIFEVHQMMMEDDGYNESVENIIQSQSGQCGVCCCNDRQITLPRCLRPWTMIICESRAADVKDISERLISILNWQTIPTHP
ncbi:MAG: phosphoenolpyruvate-utilizing N-terminal domain-containing protein [Fusicatenibacter saccharivorans]